SPSDCTASLLPRALFTCGIPPVSPVQAGKHSLLLQAEITAVSHDDVIHQFHSDDFARFVQPVRNVDVLPARMRIPAGMIVHADDSRGTAPNRFAKHLPRMNHGGVQASDKNAFLVDDARSEEHTSELQSRENLVCRLLLEKKNKTK